MINWLSHKSLIFAKIFVDFSLKLEYWVRFCLNMFNFWSQFYDIIQEISTTPRHSDITMIMVEFVQKKPVKVSYRYENKYDKTRR